MWTNFVVLVTALASASQESAAINESTSSLVHLYNISVMHNSAVCGA